MIKKAMKKITFDNEHRRKHFEFFKNMNHPHFNICANVEITNFVKVLNKYQLPFTYSVVYAIAKTAKAIKEFRWRIIDGELFECENVRPSFTTYTEVADVFSFCDVSYDENYQTFIKMAAIKAAQMSKNPSFEDSEHHDYLFLSSIPWVSFTMFQHAMPFHPTDSIPRITWGKYFEEGDKVKMPISIQAHHAVVDGRHVGLYFQEIEKLFQDFETDIV
jgi:chloramphenicol O-acetyltransferase type A|tara:strand:+ start:461 stop:1114 length:654 start_codon:yes stop_codon:yes gene_type:complete